MTAYNLHEEEERDFGRGPVLWDADPDVCCAAFQLGACAHTEAQAYDPEFDNDWVDLDRAEREAAPLGPSGVLYRQNDDDKEPF